MNRSSYNKVDSECFSITYLCFDPLNIPTALESVSHNNPIASPISLELRPTFSLYKATLDVPYQSHMCSGERLFDAASLFPKALA